MKKILINGLIVLALIGMAISINSLPIFLLGLEKRGFLTGFLRWPVAFLHPFLIIAILVVLWKWYQKALPQEIKEQKMTGADIRNIFLYYFLGRLVAIVGTLLNQLVSGKMITNNDQTIMDLVAPMKEGFAPYSFLFILGVGIVAPILEELVFRGLSDQLLNPNSKKWFGLLVTSALFSLPHASNITEFITYFAMGAILYLAYNRRGNIKDSIAVHVLNNIPAAILLAIQLFS